jgi:hypothetical protein
VKAGSGNFAQSVSMKIKIYFKRRINTETGQTLAEFNIIHRHVKNMPTVSQTLHAIKHYHLLHLFKESNADDVARLRHSLHFLIYLICNSIRKKKLSSHLSDFDTECGISTSEVISHGNE